MGCSIMIRREVMEGAHRPQLTEILRLADNNRCYPVGKDLDRTLAADYRGQSLVRQLRCSRGRTSLALRAAGAGRQNPRHLQIARRAGKRINADEEELRDNVPYDRI